MANHLKPKDERREAAINVTLTTKERDQIRRAARGEGRSVSDWMRRVALAAIGK